MFHFWVTDRVSLQAAVVSITSRGELSVKQKESFPPQWFIERFAYKLHWEMGNSVEKRSLNFVEGMYEAKNLYLFIYLC